MALSDSELKAMIAAGATDEDILKLGGESAGPPPNGRRIAMQTARIPVSTPLATGLNGTPFSFTPAQVASALPLAGATGLAAMSGGGALPFLLATMIGGGAGKIAQQAAVGEPISPGAAINSAGEMGLTVGLPELAIARTPMALERYAAKKAATEVARKAEEAAARAGTRVDAHAGMLPQIKAASASATAARAEAGKAVGEAVSGSTSRISSLDVANRIADSREAAAAERGAPKIISDNQRRGIARQVEREWRRVAGVKRKLMIDIPKPAPKASLVSANGAPVRTSWTPIDVSATDFHSIRRGMDEINRAELAAGAAGKPKLTELRGEISQAMRSQLGDAVPELKTLNPQFQQAMRKDVRLRAAVNRFPTPEEWAIRRAQSVASARNQAMLPTNEPMITWTGGNPIMGRIPFPRPNGPEGLLKFASNPRTQTAAAALARTPGGIDFLLHLLSQQPQQP